MSPHTAPAPDRRASTRRTTSDPRRRRSARRGGDRHGGRTEGAGGRAPFQSQAPEKTAGAYNGEGDYFTLGDVGYVDPDGYLFLTDRSAHLIISGGVNIYPAEVDAVLLQHPAVADAAAVGVPHETRGEEVKAVVQLKPVSCPHPLADELVEWCRGRIAHYKCPRRVEFTEALPRHDNGKLYKHQLREQLRNQ